MLSRTVVALTLVAALAVLASTASAGGPVGTASKTCKVGNTRSYGTSYVLSISVSHTSCTTGRKVVRAFHACRPGKSGHCRHRVLGYSCSERRTVGRASYDSRVTCRNGSRVVKHTYSQFT
jgi:hypothetical protein